MTKSIQCLNTSHLKVLALMSTVLLSACSYSISKHIHRGEKSDPKQDATFILHGGSILTMQGDTPNYVEAMLVENGIIKFTGSFDEAKRLNQRAQRFNLKNNTVIPGLIDAHSHANSVGLQQTVANLYSPPDGKVTDIPSLIQTMQEWKNKNPEFIQQSSGWIIGNGYDDAQLAEQRHPTATELDVISTEQPVIILHQSGHLATVNHKALELLKIDAKTPNPVGGVIRRKANSKEPNGVLEESIVFHAMIQIFQHMPPEVMEKMALTAVQTYVKNGYTTIQEGRADAGTSELWRNIAQKGKLPVDLVVYPDISTEKDYMLQHGTSRDYKHHYRIGGVKISLDGSPQGKTAWLTKPYLVPPEGQKKSYRGYAAFPQQSTVQNLIDLAFQNNWQILAHANGDAAIDQYLTTIENATAKFPAQDRRNVIIHAQTMREDQLDKAKELKLIPSFFSLHTYYWGDWHIHQTLGLQRAQNISPTGSALRKGILFTEHHDAPVIPPNSMMTLDTTVNRVTRSGVVLGADQRVSPYLALKSMTSWAAYQYFEEDSKGTLSAGKLADFVILDQNPMTIPSDQIKNIKVLATFKEGKEVFHAAN